MDLPTDKQRIDGYRITSTHLLLACLRAGWKLWAKESNAWRINSPRSPSFKVRREAVEWLMVREYIVPAGDGSMFWEPNT